jgi:hypothetical protein
MRLSIRIILCIYFILSIIAVNDSESQVSQTWVRTHNGAANWGDFGHDMILDNNGNAIVTGHSFIKNTEDACMVTIKYSPSGTIIWQSVYSENDSGAIGSKLAKDMSGSIYVAGYRTGTLLGSRLLLVKYSSTGVLLWSRTYFDGVVRYEPSDIIIDNSGNVYVSAHSYQTHQRTGVIIKYSPEGNELWRRNDSANVFDIHLDNQNNLIVLSYRSTGYHIYKTMSNGAEQWRLFISSVCGTCSNRGSIVTDSMNNIYITGRKNYDVYTVKLSPSGSFMWEKYYINNDGGSRGSKILLDKMESSIIIGGSIDDANDINFLALKYSLSGDLVWSKTYNNSIESNEIFENMSMDSYSNIYLTGSIDNGIFQTQKDFVTVKLSPSGATNWVVRFNGEGINEDYPCSVLSDNNLNVYVFGTSEGISTNYDYALVKYSQLLTGINQTNNSIPDSYMLNQNYPNPFNPITRIEFSIPVAGNVNVSVYDILGNEVEVIVHDNLQPGTYSVDFNAEKYSSGVYFYRLVSGNFTDSKKMIIAK